MVLGGHVRRAVLSGAGQTSFIAIKSAIAFGQHALEREMRDAFYFAAAIGMLIVFAYFAGS